MRWSGLSVWGSAKLHPVVSLMGQPLLQVLVSQPVPPSDLKHLAEVEHVDGLSDICTRQHTKTNDFGKKLGFVQLLQDVIEVPHP